MFSRLSQLLFVPHHFSIFLWGTQLTILLLLHLPDSLTLYFSTKNDQKRADLPLSFSLFKSKKRSTKTTRDLRRSFQVQAKRRNQKNAHRPEDLRSFLPRHKEHGQRKHPNFSNHQNHQGGVEGKPSQSGHRSGGVTKWRLVALGKAQ